MGHQRFFPQIFHTTTEFEPRYDELSQRWVEPTLPEKRRVLERTNKQRLVLALVALALALLVGILGYRILEGNGWIDSIFNASMILGGLGPVEKLENDTAKIGASFYAIFSGAFFLVFFGIILQSIIDTRGEIMAIQQKHQEMQ